MSEPRVPTIFSARRRDMRLQRARSRQGNSPDAANWFLDAMAQDAVERIGFMRLQPERALLRGLGVEQVADSLLPDCAITVDHNSADDRPLIGGPYDLIVSLARLDTVNDLPGALLHLRHALSRGGILLAIIPGAGTLPMLRRIMLAADGDRAAPRIHPQIDNRAATMLLERAGFARQVVDCFGLTVRYGSLDRLVADLRDQGLTSALANPGPPLGRQGLTRARSAFEELAEADGRVSEHFEFLTLTGWNS